MSIDSFISPISRFSSIQPPKSISETIKTEQTKPNGAGEMNFSEMFGNAIKEVDSLQKAADQQIEGLTLGKDGVTTHGAMIALEKADVAFQLMSSVRAKIVRAYEDIMRTQV